jgi:ornithine carbamoyltransferase
MRRTQKKRDLLKVSDFTAAECKAVISAAIRIKKSPGRFASSLRQETLLMLFEKPSLRTRLSFETGMTQLGGHAIHYSIQDSPLRKKENIHDTAKCASRYVDVIAARVFKRQDVRDLAAHADVPVINMLDDFGHPCQILCDFQTIAEMKGRLKGLKLAYFGDGRNNVTYDLMRAAAVFGLAIDVACPEGEPYSPEEEVVAEVKALSARSGAEVRVLHEAAEAARGADVVYTDSWMSYGIPADREAERKRIFLPYQVNSALMREAKRDAIFMNCLPAMRGMEQTADVIDGPQSVVFDQAENRLHIQKAILLFLLGKL